jgi:MFS family permease
MSSNLKRLLLANSLAFFGSGMTHLFRVLYVMDVMKVSPLRYGFLQALETVSMAILIVPIGRLADRRGNLGRKRFTALDFFFNGLFSLLIPLVPSANWFYLVFLLPGVRESLEPARKALLVDLAGKGEHGRIIGFYFFLLGVINFPASFLAGLLWEWNPIAPFLVGGSITMMGFLCMLFFGPRVEAEKAGSV